MIESLQHTFFIPRFPATSGPEQLAAICAVRLPPWWPDPAPIRRSILWIQAQAFPSGAQGDASIALDPASEYRLGSGLQSQLHEPSSLISLGVLEAFPGGTHQRWERFETPVLYRASRGDCIVVAPEFQGGFDVDLYVSIICETDGPLTAPHDINTMLAVEGAGPDGPTIIRDWSRANHQLTASGAVYNSGWIDFDGTGQVSWLDKLNDFTLPDDLTMEGEFRTTTASTQGGHNRQIISLGTGSNALGIGMSPDGKVGVINEATGFILTNATNVADGSPHTFSYTRHSGTGTLRVDGSIVGTVSDSTPYAANTPMLGRYPGGNGRFNGSLRNLKVSNVVR